MKLLLQLLLLLFATPAAAAEPKIMRDIPYVSPGDPKQTLDVYAPADAKSLPVVVWIHGGGWQAGDKKEVDRKPQFFNEKGFVFVSVNYRLLPAVEMDVLIKDVGKSVKWVVDHIGEYGGDPKRLLIAGHSAGAQLAAILCTDDRILMAEGIPLTSVIGCVPVDGDTYDIPAIIEMAETRWRLHGLPKSKFGHREKFMNDPAKHKDFSAVTHVAKGKSIPPFLIIHVAEHPDTTAQAIRLEQSLKAAEVPVTRYGGRDTTHGKINSDLGLADDPGTKALAAFIEKMTKK